jgi:hypothetical protein
VPLEAQGAVVGVLSLYRLQRDAFTNQDLTKILSLAPAAALALTKEAPALA